MRVAVYRVKEEDSDELGVEAVVLLLSWNNHYDFSLRGCKYHFIASGLDCELAAAARTLNFRIEPG